ncbi:MAG: hypothetical protein A2X61_01665 [Ignavibacteria bacterium GWB2_35_12]|nr:MAG: hypothetical protein A2X61_01665 [Ignavibacteria bacterium GWB2_35_12]OGU94928.1 MAG: hypothetical protein A2220_09375 [Ignavibacteria bacterium RIFOXYA2_FULL_35_10]OGV19566.1 MAG: hypothetical protein A2475_07490 [Ignavibacteria bacterium RIFOXYC2_FULL_35_21]
MNEYVITRIESIQMELKELKSLLKPSKKIKKVINLENLWKGIDISDSEIDEAKKAIFGKYDKIEL